MREREGQIQSTMVGSPNSSEGSQLRFPHGENSATVDTPFDTTKTPGLGPEDTTTLGARWNLGFTAGGPERGPKVCTLR